MLSLQFLRQEHVVRDLRRLSLRNVQQLASDAYVVDVEEHATISYPFKYLRKSGDSYSS